MRIQGISAVTLAVGDMNRAVEFYRKLGMNVTYGGDDSTFTTIRAGADALNLVLTPEKRPDWWGRVIIRVDGVDELNRRLKDAGLSPEDPRDGGWGERFFHMWDPDGNELSFAEVIASNPES